MDIAQVITGWITILVGAVLFVVSIFVWPLFIYSIPLLIIGVLILMDFGREKKIERIKSKK